jgi:hypothetical protein
MASTYKAILHGDHLKWNDEAPVRRDHGVAVVVTVLDEALPAAAAGRGARMAAALERLAAAGGPGIADPVEWQREVRDERTLPEREE